MTIEQSPIGIDLGTTFSVVAYLDANGQPQTLSNSDGDLTTPSVVLLEDGEPVVGKEAVKASTMEPDAIAQFMKRDIGKAEYLKLIRGTKFPPEVLQALILRKLRQDTIDRLGVCEDVVITVPAYFNEPRRKATQDAGRMAGLNVLDIINEPTAAAIAFGVRQGFVALNGNDESSDETVMIYDLGGGTFDVSIMKIEGNKYTVLATDGNVQLGGIDFDRALVKKISEEYEARYGTDPRDDPAAQQRLFREAEEAKRALSARDKVTVAFEHLTQGIRVPITRDEFEQMTAHLIERSRFTVTNLLRTAGLTWDDITRLLLVGGSTRMPMVATMLESESGKTIDRALAADEAVAHGAAIYAGLLREHGAIVQKNMSVTNVCSHSLGVLGLESSTGREKTGVMIPANSKLPASKSAAFKTYRDNQSSVVVNVVEGGDASGNNATPIGRCVVRGLPPDLPANTPVNVKFKYLANGRLQVSANVPSVDVGVSMAIERASGLTDESIREWAERIEFNELLIDSPSDMALPSEEGKDPPSTKNSSAVATSSRTGPPAMPGRESSPPPKPISKKKPGPPAMPGAKPGPPKMPDAQSSPAAGSGPPPMPQTKPQRRAKPKKPPGPPPMP